MSNQEFPASKVGETTEPKFSFGVDYAEYIVLLTKLMNVQPGLVLKLELTDVRDREDWSRKRLVLEWVDAVE